MNAKIAREQERVTYEDILYQSQNGIAEISLNRPEKLNAFRGKTLVEIDQSLHQAIKDRSIGVIVISGIGGRAFCVGGDIEEMLKLNQKTGATFVKHLEKLAKTFCNCPKPIIAKVNGYCLGGGHEIQLFCDLTIASEKSIFGQSGPKVGSAPLWGGTQILPLLVGLKKAHEVTFLCQQYSAREALGIGLINRVVPEISLDSVVETVCREILEKAPRALALARKSLHEGLFTKIQKGLKDLSKIYGGPELREGMTAFLEKRTPSFRGLLSPTAPLKKRPRKS